MVKIWMYLSQIGENISTFLPDLEGTDNFYVEQTVGQPYLTIEIDREAVASFGLNVDDVQKVIEAGIGGQEASQVYEGQRRFGIVVRYPEDIRNQLVKIQNVPVHLPNGDFVPLKRVANIDLQEGPREIQRENGWRRLIVGINIKNIDLGSYVANLQKKIIRVPIFLQVILLIMAEHLKISDVPCAIFCWLCRFPFL